jgi:hypothetical protein
MEQLALWAVRIRVPPPKPPKRKPRRYRLLRPPDLKNGIRVTFRIGEKEAAQLVDCAKDYQWTISELVRDALYEQYRIGEFEGES